MKALIVGEFRDGKTLPATYELVAFAAAVGAEAQMFIVGAEAEAPKFDGKLYLADAGTHGEFNPEAHKKLLLDAVEASKPDCVVFSHSYYGYDLAPRIAAALGAAQVSETVGFEGGSFIVPACNSKMRRKVKPETDVCVVTVQAGAYPAPEEPQGTPQVEKIDAEAVESRLEVTGYEKTEPGGADLTKAEVIVTAGRGVGKKENMEIVESLAKALGGEVGASRPVVDAGWADYNRQVGTSGQTVAPKLYIACGVSGAIQHLAGMKKSGFIVAINTDKDAPIGEVADVLAVADVKQLAPAIVEKIGK